MLRCKSNQLPLRITFPNCWLVNIQSTLDYPYSIYLKIWYAEAFSEKEIHPSYMPCLSRYLFLALDMDFQTEKVFLSNFPRLSGQSLNLQIARYLVSVSILRVGLCKLWLCHVVVTFRMSSRKLWKFKSWQSDLYVSTFIVNWGPHVLTSFNISY